MDRYDRIALRSGIIAYVEVHTQTNRETLYEPEEIDIRRLCEAYGFDVEETLNTIRNRSRDIHGFIFVETEYKKHCDEVKEKRRAENHKEQ